ncbi:MAG: hypothetical protein IBJ03_14590 [Gemmatimonadaceae bacterium]|nr:hypothetical protein [Gemmatimonadaceae bacterium]
MIRYQDLRDRFTEDTAFGGGGASPSLTAALDAIGWRAVQEPTPEELAEFLADLVQQCVHLHRDVSVLSFEIARALRDTGPLLDGGLPPVEAYLPAADEILRRYCNR